jgi:glycopeptide antibiotics resistance protein
VTQLWRAFGYLVPLAVVGGAAVGLVVFGAAWARRRFERSPTAVGQAVGDALLAVWGIAFVAVTLWVRRATLGVARVDLVPFGDLRGYAHAVSWQVPFAQVGGNLVLYGTLGVLLAARFRWGVGRTAAVAGAVAALDEALQWLLPTGRSATTDDVVVAVVGAALGAVLVGLARVATRSATEQPATPAPTGAG